jgi:ATP-dependent DNA helicase RecG
MLDYPISLQAGPGPLLVFVPEPDPDLIAETAVALANTDGGAMVIGLDSGGAYTGAVDGTILAAALDGLVERCNPAITLGSREQIDSPHGPLIAVRVQRSTGVHALSDGRVLVRAGRTNRILDGAEIRRLVTTKTHGEFEVEAVPGTKPGELDPELIADFLVKRAARLKQPLPGSEDGVLMGIGAVSPAHQVTVSGTLLFSQAPQRLLPQSGVHFVRYVGRRARSDEAAAVHNLEGPLVRLVEQVWELIAEQMQEAEYPAFAVREALINAVCHRDYRLRGRGIDVLMFADRLEISSPGGLPGFLTVDYLTDGRFSRNPRLSCCLFQWGYIEEPGLGVNRLFDVMESHGRRPPQIEARPYTVTVRLSNAPAEPGTRSPSSSEAALNERQITVLDFVQQHGSITLRELRTLYPAIRPDLLQHDVAALVEQGHLRKIGSRSSAYYILA